jgi:hypothetical protein
MAVVTIAVAMAEEMAAMNEINLVAETVYM